MRTGSVMLALAAALWAQPAAAQTSAVAQAIAAGEAGERYDGYLGPVSAPSPELKRQLDAINLRRRNLYIELAQRRNVTAQVVGLATACQLFSQLGTGEAYLLEDAIWRRRGPGQAAPVPRYCR